MISEGGDSVLKLPAIVDLSRADAGRIIENAVSVATVLRGDLTLLSVVARRQYEKGKRYVWPRSAFGGACSFDVHRVALPGIPAGTLAVYADWIGADLLLIPAEYRVRAWLRKPLLACVVAAITSRAICILPVKAGVFPVGDLLRVGCMLRLYGTDDRRCMVARAMLHRYGGELVLLYVGYEPDVLRRSTAPLDRGSSLEALERMGRWMDVPWSAHVIDNYSGDAITAAVIERKCGLIVAGRRLYVNDRADVRDMLTLVNLSPCPVLSVPFSSVSTASSVLNAREHRTRMLVGNRPGR